MTSVNLIPRDVLEQRRRRERRRLWVLAATLAWCLVLIPLIREQQAEGQLLHQQALMGQMTRRLQISRQHAAASAARLGRIDADLELARRLRAKRAWSGMLAAVTGVLPQRICLTSLTSAGGSNAAGTADAAQRTPGSAPPSAPQTPGRQGPKRLVLQDQAMQLEDVYDCKEALSKLGVFEEVVLAGVGSGQLRAARITSFSLECSW